MFAGNGGYCSNCNDQIISKFVEYDRMGNHEQPYSKDDIIKRFVGHDHIGDHEQSRINDVEVVDFKKFRTMGKRDEFEFVGLL